MFLFPIAKPQGCDIQTFYGTNGVILNSWNKPVGVSHVYMMLIGPGGNGDGTNGGGSGAVTVWYGAAQHVPDSLVIQAGTGAAGTSSFVYFRSRSTSIVALLEANCAIAAPTGGPAMPANQFTASGFFQSTAGQDGGSTITASATTFLSGGGGSSDPITANYGYSLPATAGNFVGRFQMQPIIVGLGSKGTARGAIGCGGGLTSGTGGPGMVLIASW
jgi:hypothetical protein